MKTLTWRGRMLPLALAVLAALAALVAVGSPVRGAEVLAWGEGVATPRATFQGLAGHQLTQVSATGSAACGIDDRGWAFCWGSDASETVGDGSGFGASSPVAVDRSGALKGKQLVQISVGGWSVCALDTDGLAYCWGAQDGPLGAPGPHPSPAPPVAVSTDGVLAGETLRSISVGGSHACAVSDSGSAFCWGEWPLGSLDDGSAVPVAVDTSGVLDGKTLVDIDAGSVSTCALDDGGDAFCWGRDGSGQLGDGGPIGDTDASDVPVRVTDTGALDGKALAQISVGGGTACALDTAGLAYCWGNNLDGELGVGGGPSSSVPVAVDTSGALQGKTLMSVETKDFHTCALDTDGRGYCWGYGADGRLGTGNDQTAGTPTAVVTDGVLAGRTLTQISPGGSGTCSLAANGRAYCWGLGVLGNGSRGSSSVPVAVQHTPALAGVNVVQMSSTYRQACLVTMAGDVQCWGQGDDGALGDGYPQGSSTPVTVRTRQVTGDIAAVSTAPYNSCLLTRQGRAYCWGDGGFGALGDADPSWDNAFKPVPVDTSGALAGKKLVALSTGFRASCALDTEGAAYCWGENQGGAMGNGTTSSSSPPVEVDRSGAVGGRAFTGISAGQGWACAIDTKGKAYCWGGVVGADYLPYTASPTRVDPTGVLAGKTLTDVSVSGTTACAIDTKGKAYCWGYGPNGELGDGGGATSATPVAVRTAGALDRVRLVDIRVGSGQVCAVDATSRGYCWGAGAKGQLGNGMSEDSLTPVPVSTATALRGRALLAVQPTGFDTWALSGAGPIPAGRPGLPVKEGPRTVSWATPTDNGGAQIKEYVVSVAGAGTWRTSATSVRLSGLTDGRYDVRVRAVNAAGPGLWSHAANLSLGR